MPRPSSSPLVERDAELRTIDDFFAAPLPRHQRLLLLTGPAGIGKTRLLDAAAGVARRRGFRTARATARPLDATLGFGLARHLLEPLPDADDLPRATLLAGTALLAESLIDPASSAPGAQEAIEQGLFRLWCNAGDQRPLCLLADDLQWADPASLRALLHAVERPERANLVVVATIRDGERGTDDALLDQLRAATDPLRPSPLSAAGVAALARDAGLRDPDAPLIRACVDGTGGNPLLAHLSLASLADSAGPDADLEGWRRLTGQGAPSVDRHVRRRLAQLDPGDDAIARIAAVLGDGAAVRQVARLAERPLADAAAALDRLAACDLLQDADPLRFAHPLVRDAVYRALPTASRRVMHLNAARVLRDDGHDPERIATHLLRSTPDADAATVDDLLRAAAGAMRHALPASAVTYLRRAVEEPPPPRKLATVLLELGRAEAAAGETAAPDTLAAAAERLDAPAAIAEAQLLRGRALYARGELVAAAEAFDAGLAVLGSPDDERTRVLTAELEAAFISAARFDARLQPEAQRRLAPLLDRAATADTPAGRALLAEIALERGIRGDDPTTVVDLALRAWADGRLLDDGDPQGIVLAQIAATLTWSDALDDSDRVLTATLERAEAAGTIHAQASAAYLRSWPRLYRGALADADRDARRALATPGWEMFAASARAVVAIVALERGDVVAADEALDVPDAEQRWPGSIPYAMFLDAAGRRELQRGAWSVAHERFVACGALVGAIGAPHPFCPWKPLAGYALAAAGDHERADALVAEAIADAERYRLARPHGVALRTAGAIALEIRHDPVGARPLLERAERILRPTGAELEHVHALLLLGSALRQSERADTAHRTLRTAADVAARLGAHVVEERARAELVASGLRPRRSASTGRDALTASEQRIARMAAAGWSNAGIAEQLVIQPKTVQFHLTNAYRKLGIAGRDGLSGALGVGDGTTPSTVTEA